VDDECILSFRITIFSSSRKGDPTLYIGFQWVVDPSEGLNVLSKTFGRLLPKGLGEDDRRENQGTRL